MNEHSKWTVLAPGEAEVDLKQDYLKFYKLLTVLFKSWNTYKMSLLSKVFLYIFSGVYF